MTLALDRSQWKPVKFCDVARLVKGVSVPTVTEASKYIGLEHMPTDGSLQIDTWGSDKEIVVPKTLVSEGDVLFARRNTHLRRAAVAPHDGHFSPDGYAFRAIEESMLHAFLPWVVLSAPFMDYAVTHSAGTHSKRVRWEDLAKFQFMLPPLDQQKRIADILWAIERHRLRISRLSETVVRAKSVMIADSLARGVEQKGWARDRVASLVNAGPMNGKSAPANDENRGVPTLSISAVRGGVVLGGKSVKYIDVDPASVAGFVLQDDDFLIVRGNGNRQLTGRGGLVVGGLPSGCIYPDLLIRLRFNASRMLPRFGAEQWNSVRVHGALLASAKSTNGIWKINGKDIKEHSLVVPPLPDQAMVLDQLQSYDSSILAADAEVSTLARLRGMVLSTVLGGN